MRSISLFRLAGGASVALGLFGCSTGLFGGALSGNQLDAPADTSGLGTLSAFYCNYGDSSYPMADIPVLNGYDTDGLVTYEEAIDECELIAVVQDDESIYCEWKGQPIFLRETSAGDCDDARVGGEPGDGLCSDAPELNIISSYEARSDHGNGAHPTGTTNVHIERSGPQVVVLSSYEPVEWNVTAAPGAQIVQLIATGYYTPTVNAPAGVPVEILSYDASGEFVGCAYEFPDSDPFSGCETPEYFRFVEELTGLEVTSFHGCYQLTEATLGADLQAVTNCDDPSDEASQGGYVATSYQDPDCAGSPDEDCTETEVNVLSVYEARSDHSGNYHPTGELAVHVERQSQQVLVLSSYEPVNWTVTAAPGAELQRVVALGFHAQSVQAPPGVAVEVYSVEQNGVFFGCAFEFPDSDLDGCETDGLLSSLETILGLPITSFYGSYRLTNATLHADLSLSADAVTEQGYALTGFVNEVQGCDDGGDNSDELGLYVGFLCDEGHPFIITEQISRADALANCELNANANPDLSFYCEWNGEAIFLEERSPGACSAYTGDAGDDQDDDQGDDQDDHCGDSEEQDN
jgi:hypothetical protein